MKLREEYNNLLNYIKLTEQEAVKRDMLCEFLEGDKFVYLDADSLIYKVAYNSSEDYNADIVYEDFLAQVRAIVNTIEEDINCCGIFYFFTTCKSNFRKKILPSYKANRPKNDLTKLVHEIKETIITQLIIDGEEVFTSNTLEADDLISACCKGENDHIIASIDKDLKQITGAHFDYYKQKTGEQDAEGFDLREFRGWSYTTPQEGYDMLLKQLLIGDNADNIKGVKGIGVKGAEKIVTGSNFEKLLKVARKYDDTERLRLNIKLMKL